MKSKAKILVPTILILIIAAALAVYFAVFETFTIVQDTTWKEVMPKCAYLDLRLKLVKDKTRLRVRTIDQITVFDESGLAETFSHLDTGGVVLASPLVTVSAIRFKVNVAELLVNTYVYGIGLGNDKGFFDEVLVSDDLSGWEMAAKEAWQEGLKAALITDFSTQVQGNAVYSNIQSDSILKYDVNDFGNLFAPSILADMEENNVNVVFCPHTDNMREFFIRGKNDTKWVTDYRFSYVVPKDNLVGVVCPDIYTSLKSEDGVLHYEYRSVNRSLF